MKKILMLFLFAVAMMAQNAEAQTKKKPASKSSPSAKTRAANEKAKKEEKEKAKTASEETTKETTKEDSKFGKDFWTTKMMYGSYINYPRFGQGIFNMSLSPMAGYKVTPELAVGVLTKINYTWLKNPNPVESPYQLIDFGVGIFARAKILRVLLLHAEYERTKYSGFDSNSSTPTVIKLSETSANLGIGYISGYGAWKYEIGFYYDILYPEKSKLGTTVKQTPFEYRAAITYNF